jgi:myosin-5
MELNQQVWFRRDSSHWGWVPAVIVRKEEVLIDDSEYINLTVVNDRTIEGHPSAGKATHSSGSQYFADEEDFQEVIQVDPEQLKAADHDDIKLRNLPSSFQIGGGDPEAGALATSSVVGGVDDLIELTHLHEPAILHALRLRYDSDIIYTATGPILIAVNPFKPMDLYSDQMMESYRLQGEQGLGSSTNINSPTKMISSPFPKGAQPKQQNVAKRLPPHAYQAADDAYRHMVRGLENKVLMNTAQKPPRSGKPPESLTFGTPTNQSILVSGESGAGKTVTTKIVLNYFAMLSRKRAVDQQRSTPTKSPREPGTPMSDDVSIEQQVLQSNPILESFGNARTIRNDNSSRFGKYIDISFTKSGKLSGASIETYLLEKVRLIHPSPGERNYHIFYQFLKSATARERQDFFIGSKTYQDFRLLSESGTFTRRDGVDDEDNHSEMLNAMMTIGFTPETIQSLMRLISAILYAGNMSFTPSKDMDSCKLDKTKAALACAALLGITFDGLASALTSRSILAGDEIVHKPLTIEESGKACEALIKAVYGAVFDFIVEKVNQSIVGDRNEHGRQAASIGVLDIFGFETFEINSFEQICINYTNEALQQQFNRYVFKLEQQEYEKEGIMWKFISFPDNQDVLDLIDMKHTGILALLDEQCILPKSTDQKFTRYLYARCDRHPRFSATSAQRVDYVFSVEHYAGLVEYTTDSWLEKNKDQLPSASSELLRSSDFELLLDINRFVRSEDRAGRGTVATKSVSAQFSSQLRILRSRIEKTVPHYIRCLKPNDELAPDYFEPKDIVEQLRCGGVLEAVRVSRAGYPTRYPHDVFMARYYILGDPVDKTPQSPLFPTSMISAHDADKKTDLKRLISKIAYDLWQIDHEVMQAQLKVEKARRESLGVVSNYAVVETRPRNPTKMNSGAHAPPFSLAVESSVMTPETQRAKRKKQRDRRESHQVARPDNHKEFMQLDFASRCAVAGLQLGRSKVFLRREAFDRIEGMRSEKFYKACSTIQKLVRGKLCRVYYQHMRNAAITIQSAMRMMLSTQHVADFRVHTAAVTIQCSWRLFVSRMYVFELMLARRTAARMIQRYWREYKAPPIGPSEEDILRAVVAVQSIYRGGKCREDLYNNLSAPSPSPVKTLSPEVMRHLESPIESPMRAIIPSPAVHSPVMERQMTPAPTREVSQYPDSAMLTELFREIQEENWAMVENILDKHPELAEASDLKSGELALHKIARHTGAWTLLIDMVLVLYPKALIHRDNMGALPIHHASAHDNLAALEIIYSAYKEGINDTDKMGRLPIHVAANYDAVDAIKFLLTKSPEGAYTMVYRPPNNSGGGLPLHIACRNHASIGVITALLAENFASAKRTDENGDLPLHLLLRCGEVVDPVVVKTLLTCFSGAVSRTDMNGDLPLAIAIKYQCSSTVTNAILMQYPEAAGALNGEGHSPLHLSFKHNADDRTIMGLLNHAPELSTQNDRKTGLLPIQVATENEHSHFIVHNLLKRDMPIDIKEKVRAQLLPHHYSWNHIVSNTEDMYHQVVTKVLQSCTQPQVLALAHIEGPDGKIALAAATPVCKHEMRVMLRLFNTLEVVNQRPAYTNPVSDTQIFYALRYDPPAQSNGAFTVLHEEKNDGADDYIEDWDDASHVSGVSKTSIRSTLTSRSQQSIEDKLRLIRREKGQQVIAKLTSRSEIVERELKVRKDFHLSRHYVPAIISVHHTVQHAAYSEAMAEPGYCITMEGADTTAENLMLDMRKSGKRFPGKSLKRIGISLLHLHEHGIIHGDFGTHNIGKFGSRWKLLGVGGSVSLGCPTDPTRGFYHPPESIIVENKRVPMGKKSFTATVVSIPGHTTYDIWAYGVALYEAIAGVPLGPYACRGKRAMSSTEVCKIGLWDDASLKKALKHVPENELGRDLLKRLLHHDPEQRISSMRHVLEHPFFTHGSVDGNGRGEQLSPTNTLNSEPSHNSRSTNNSRTHKPATASNGAHRITGFNAFSDPPDIKLTESIDSSLENRENGVPKKTRGSNGTSSTGRKSDESMHSQKSGRSFGGLRKIRSTFRRQAAS